MGAISDVTGEFKQAGPKEKAVIILAVIGVAGVAWYLYSQRQATASQQGVLNARSGTETPQPTGYPETSHQVPTIPFGVNPLYDPAGNLIAFQNPGNMPPPQPPTVTHPQNWYTNLLGKVGYGTTIRPGGYDANGQRFWVGATGNSNEFYAPIGSTIQYGAQGRVWLSPNGDQTQHVLLTGPGKT